MTKIGILGSGEVGRTLGAGFAQLGHEVKLGTRNPKDPKVAEWAKKHKGATVGTFEEAAKFGQTLVFAINGKASEEAIKLAGPQNFKGKTVIDTTNALDFKPNQMPTLFVSGNDSLAERIQKWLPGAKVVKAFNAMSNAVMFKPNVSGGPDDLFIAGDDAAAKKEVSKIVQDFGHNPIDLGPLMHARYIEALAMVYIVRAIMVNDWMRVWKLAPVQK